MRSMASRFMIISSGSSGTGVSAKYAERRPMRAEIIRFFGTVDVARVSDKKQRKKLDKIDKELAALKTSPS